MCIISSEDWSIDSPVLRVRNLEIPGILCLVPVCIKSGGKWEKARGSITRNSVLQRDPRNSFMRPHVFC